MRPATPFPTSQSGHYAPESGRPGEESRSGGFSRTALASVLLLDTLLVASCLLPTIRASYYLPRYILGATGVLVAWQLVLLWASMFRGTRLAVQRRVTKAHWAQLCAQAAIYVYWSLYWPPVREHVPVLVVQILFAYAVDMVLTWSRGRVWYAGFGPFPIIISINFFLWFRAPYFYLQFVLVALTYVAKHFIQWKRDGQWRHIFNPSGFSLSVMSLGLLATNSIYTTSGLDFILSFQLPPNIFEVMFLAGLFIQIFAPVVLISFGAVLAILLWCLLPLGPAPVDPAVFLGLTLAVTDPVTSPRSSWGKFLFGMLYGVGVCVTFTLLRSLVLPSYFDKLLIIPVLNLTTPVIDKFAHRIRFGTITLGHRRHVLLYACFFLAIVPFLQLPLRNAVSGTRSFVPPADLDPSIDLTGLQASPEMQQLMTRQKQLLEAHPEWSAPFSFLNEPEYWRSWNSY